MEKKHDEFVAWHFSGDPEVGFDPASRKAQFHPICVTRPGQAQA